MNLLKHAIATNQNFTKLMQLEQEKAMSIEQQKQGLLNSSNNVAMTFPNSKGSFHTKGMKYNVDISKTDNKGNIVQSYRNVPPGIDNLPMGGKVGTVIETPSQYKKGGYVSIFNKK